MTGAQTVAFLREELSDFPGRTPLAARIVLGVLFALVLVMAFRIPLGWLSLYFCFALAKPTTKETLFTCGVLMVAVLIALLVGLLLLKYAAEPDWLRIGILAAVLYGGFFLSRTMSDGDLARDFTIALAIVLTLPDVLPYPHLWERAALWMIPVCLAGTASIVVATWILPPERFDPRVSRKDSLPRITMPPDLLRNRDYRTYALKGTIAAMACYFCYTILQFQGIHTALVTCLIVAMPSTELIVRKTVLRIVGAAIGALIALVAVIWIIPASEGFGTLLLILGCGSAVGAWVAVGSERIAYAGWQIGLAQFMMLTHGFGPTTDLTVLRDRLIGILLGNLMMGAMFTVVWPERGGRRKLLGGLAALAIAVFPLLLIGCRSPESHYPASPPSGTFEPPNPGRYQLPAQGEADGETIDPDHRYSLAELMDLALRNRPETRIAWEKARMAAAAAGLAGSADSPVLALELLAGIDRTAFPLPEEVFPQGHFTADFAALRPEITLDWILLDFGRSGAAEAAALETAAAEGFAFDALRQEVLFEVAEAYFQLLRLRAEQRVVEAAVEETSLLVKQAREGLANGLADRKEALRAERFAAEYQFDREALKGRVLAVRARLAEAAGLDPSAPPLVRDYADVPLPPKLDETVSEWLRLALHSRPDLKARVAQVRSAEAAIEEAASSRRPVLALNANAGPAFYGFEVENGGWVTDNEPLYAAGLAFRWSIFEGDRTSWLRREAEAAVRAAEAEFRKARNAAIREVWTAFTDYRSARAQLRAAQAWVDAADESLLAARAAFDGGIGDAGSLQTELTASVRAKSQMENARNDVFLALAGLRLAAGRLQPPTLSGERVVP